MDIADGMGQRVVEREFRVDDDAVLQVDSQAGSITVVGGNTDTIEIVATVRSPRKANLDKVTVEMTQSGDKVHVETKRKGIVNNVSVAIVARVPKGATLVLHTDAGNVSVENMVAEVEAHTNAGSVELSDIIGEVRAHSNAGAVRAEGLRGEARLSSNAGAVEYEGDPEGKCSFESNAGSVTLTLPSDLEAEVDLRSSAGSVSVDFDVRGSVERSRVEGVIGDGGDCEIEARTSAGSVKVRRR